MDNPQTTANPITKGEWWTKNDSDKLFISIDSKIASDFRIKINDQITLNILGREIIGTVKNFRKVDYRDLSINFAIIINDSFADELPYEYIGTLSSNLSINEIQSKILKQFPNISIIKIGNILSKVTILLNKILIAIISISLVVVGIGLMVIISAILVQTNLRTYQNLIYKILGINFSTLVKAVCLEFLFIYLSILFFAIVIAALGSYYIVENIFQLEWIFDLDLTLTLTMGTGIITFILILITNKNTFDPPIYPLIRNEWGDWGKLLRSTYSEDGNPLSAMCIKTDMGFQTISSSFIALPSFKSKLNKNKPIFRHANGSPDCTSYDDLKI